LWKANSVLLVTLKFLRHALQRTAKVAITIGAAAFIGSTLWAVTDSESFGHCIHQYKNHHAYHRLYEEAVYLIVMVTRLRLHLACGFVATSENGEAVTAISTIAIAGFTCTLWWVTWGMVRIARDQRDDTLRLISAAKQSADASLLALRPWVSCEVRIIGDLAYLLDGNPYITIRFILTNHGRSPAMGVRLLHWVHLMSPVHTPSVNAQQKIAGLLKDLPAPDYGLLLFPGSTHKSDVKIVINRTEIEKSIEDIKPQKHFFPELIVLISYTYPLASHNPQTGLIYHVQKIIPDGISGFAFDLDEVVPAGNIRLLDHGLWSKYAT
jgi:hypothetical protein